MLSLYCANIYSAAKTNNYLFIFYFVMLSHVSLDMNQWDSVAHHLLFCVFISIAWYTLSQPSELEFSSYWNPLTVCLTVDSEHVFCILLASCQPSFSIRTVLLVKSANKYWSPHEQTPLSPWTKTHFPKCLTFPQKSSLLLWDQVFLNSMWTSFCRYNGAETQDETIFGKFSAFCLCFSDCTQCSASKWGRVL